MGEKKVRVRVLVRCVKCRSERWIGPGEIPPGETPICPDCCLPQVAVRAEGTIRR